MSVVIVGGNDCMIRKYKEICEQYKCSAKVFTHMKTDLKKQIGCPDLLVLFTGTMSHKMARCAISEPLKFGICAEKHSGDTHREELICLKSLWYVIAHRLWQDLKREICSLAGMTPSRNFTAIFR